MPRNVSGTMSLVAGNPVVSNTSVSTVWANNTLADIAAELTDSLSRSGKGGMSSPLRTADGSAAAPAHSFTSETGTGVYRKAASDLGIAIAGNQILDVNAAGVGVLGALAVVSDIGLDTAATQAITKSGGTLQIGTSDGNEVEIIRNGSTVLATTSTSLDAKSRPIINVTNPTNDTDADTKGARNAAIAAVTNDSVSWGTGWADVSGRTRLTKHGSLVILNLDALASSGNGALIGTLPAGYRPVTQIYASMRNLSAGTSFYVAIYTNGTINAEFASVTDGNSVGFSVAFSTI